MSFLSHDRRQMARSPSLMPPNTPRVTCSFLILFPVVWNADRYGTCSFLLFPPSFFVPAPHKVARSPQLIVDDEYHEQVAIYQSVLRARGHLVVGELGGRWGTWGARAIAFAKARRPELTYTLYDAEAVRQPSPASS